MARISTLTAYVLENSHSINDILEDGCLFATDGDPEKREHVLAQTIFELANRVREIQSVMKELA